MGAGGPVVGTSTMTAPMSRRPANTPWSCAWSATSTVRVVVPSLRRVMSSSPSQADQWSSRWPSTRIAYVVGAVLTRALHLAEDRRSSGHRLRGPRRRRRVDGLGRPALVAPQRGAEADQRDAGGHRERAVEGL